MGCPQGCSSAMGLSHATGVHRPRGAAVGSASQESGHQLRPSLPLSLGDRARHVTWWSQVQGRQPVQGGTACACCRAIKVPVAAATTRDTKHPRFVALLCDPDTAPTASAKELTLPSDPPWLGALPMRGNKTAPFITQLSWSGAGHHRLLTADRLLPDSFHAHTPLPCPCTLASRHPPYPVLHPSVSLLETSRRPLTTLPAAPGSSTRIPNTTAWGKRCACTHTQ